MTALKAATGMKLRTDPAPVTNGKQGELLRFSGRRSDCPLPQTERPPLETNGVAPIPIRISSFRSTTGQSEPEHSPTSRSPATTVRRATGRIQWVVFGLRPVPTERPCLGAKGETPVPIYLLSFRFPTGHSEPAILANFAAPTTTVRRGICSDSVVVVLAAAPTGLAFQALALFSITKRFTTGPLRRSGRYRWAAATGTARRISANGCSSHVQLTR